MEIYVVVFGVAVLFGSLFGALGVVFWTGHQKAVATGLWIAGVTSAAALAFGGYFTQVQETTDAACSTWITEQGATRLDVNTGCVGVTPEGRIVLKLQD